MSQFIDGKFQIKNNNVTLPLGNKLGIGITNSNSELDVNGTLQISKEYDNSSIPSTPADNEGGILYVKSTDGRLYYKSHNVTEKDLTANASGGGEINTMLNLGASAIGAVGIYDRKDDSTLKLKTLKAGQNIVLTTDHNHIMITSTASGGGGGGGTVTDGINEGIDNGGKGIFIDSLNEALRFRSVRGITSTGIKTETNNTTSTIDFTYTRGHILEKGDTNIIVIDEPGQSGGFIKFNMDGNEKLRIIDNGNLGIGVTNPDESIELAGRIHLRETTEPSSLGSGDGGKLYVKNDGKLYFKSSHALTPKSIVDSVSNAINLGTSNNNLFRSKDGENLEFRSLKAGNNIIISTENNEIVLTSAGGAYRGPGGSAAEYMVKKTRFISAPSQWGGNTLGITSTAINGDNTTITTSSAHNISFTAGDTLNLYITGTSVSNTELNDKYHEILSASGSTIEIKTKTTSIYTGGTIQLNYGNYTNTTTSKNLTHLDHSLGAGYHYIFVTWTSKFNDRPLDDQILELYHKSSVFSDGVDANLSGATLLQTIYRSNATSDYHSMSQAFYLSIPEATTYYFRWVRKSRGEYHWGTDSLQMNDELINVDYITPSLNFWSLSQYTAETGFNYPIIHYGTGTTLGGRVGIGTTIPDADMEIAGTIHISEAQSTDPPAPLDRNDGGILYVKDNGHLYFRNYLKTVDMVTVATGGEANFLETRGNGASIFIDKFESDLRVRSFIGGNGIGVTTTSSNEIQISRTNMLPNGYLGIGISTPDNMLDVNGGLGLREITSPATPSANNGGVLWTSTDGKLYFKSNEISSGRELSDYVIGSNIGSGVGIYKQRTNDNLEFKKIISGNAQITVTDDTSNDSIKLTNNITLNNATGSIGTSLLKNNGLQTDYQLKTITGGVGVSIGTQGDHTLIINNTGGGGSGGSIAYSGAGGSGAEYMSKKAYFSNNADISISSIIRSSNNRTIINTSTDHKINYFGASPNEPSVIKITGALGGDASILNGKFHNVIEITDDDTFIIDTNIVNNPTSGGTSSFNYDNYSSSGNPINLHTLDYSLRAGKHYIFVNWNSNFNENPLDDQELELYYLTGSSFTESIDVAVTGIKLESLFRSNKTTFNQTISKTIYLEVPNGQTYNLRWIRKSKNDFGWSSGISNLIDEKITVDYITPSLSYWTLGQHNISGTNFPTIYFGESSTNTNLGRVGIGISTPLQPLHVKGNSFYDGNVGIGDNAPGTKLQITGSEPYLTLKNSTNENNDGGCESRIIFEDHGNNTLGQIQVSHDGSADDTKGDLIFSTSNGVVVNESMRIDSIGNIGIGDNAPGTKLQITGTEPYITLKNSTNENTDGGCESKIIFEDHDNIALGQIQCSHNGIGIDTKGDLIFSTNDGSSLGEKMRIDSDGNLLIKNNIYPLIDNTTTESVHIGKYFYPNYYQGSFSTYVNEIKSQPWYGNQSLTKQIADSDISWSRKNFIYNVNESTQTLYYYDSYGNSNSSGAGFATWSQKVQEFTDHGHASWISLTPIMSFNSNSVGGGYVSIPSGKMMIGNPGGPTASLVGHPPKSELTVDNGIAAISNSGGNLYIGTSKDSYWQLSTDPYGSNMNLYLANTGNGANGGSGYFDYAGKVYAIDFTGQHRSLMNDYNINTLSNYIGLIVCANKNKYTKIDKDICKGNKAININESLPDVSLCNKDSDKSVYGVISNTEEKNKREYETGLLVTTFEPENGDTRTIINSLGEGGIWVSDKNGNLESGDYITSCTIPGYGMKQDSEFLANYTVAKITMDCDFNPVTQPVPQIVKDSEGNNILDSNGYLQWEDHETETEKAYNIRHLLADGTQITEADYTTRKSNGENVYKAAFVGCTYHCG